MHARIDVHGLRMASTVMHSHAIMTEWPASHAMQEFESLDPALALEYYHGRWADPRAFTIVITGE